MAVKGVAQIAKNVGQWRVKIEKQLTPKVLIAILQDAGVASKLMAPVDTNTMINSQHYELDSSGTKGVLMYRKGFSKTDFNYASFLHENVYADGSKVNWSPVKKPNAEHHFLSKAFESPEYKSDYMDIIFRGYKL